MKRAIQISEKIELEYNNGFWTVKEKYINANGKESQKVKSYPNLVIAARKHEFSFFQANELLNKTIWYKDGVVSYVKESSKLRNPAARKEK